MTFATQANAQNLARLHVRSFELSADKTDVTVGQPFHLSLDIHIDEHTIALENVQLPSLAGFEDLGDERRCTIAQSGTDCVETVTIDALAPGDHTLGPALMEFVDATTGRQKTRESNAITIHVTGTAKVEVNADNPPDQQSIFTDILWTGLRGLLILVLVAVALWALLWGYRRRPRPVVPPPAQPADLPIPVVPSEIAWEQRMRELGAALAAEPTRERAVAVRAEIRAHIGAGERETIADLTSRNAAAGDTHVMTALVAVERAAFCQDAHVADAAREAVPYLMQ